MKYLIVVLLSFMMVGCFTDKAVTKRIHRNNDKNPSTVARVTRALYPITFDSTQKRIDTFWRSTPINIDSLLAELEPSIVLDTVFQPDSSCVLKADSLVVLTRKQGKVITALRKELEENPKIIEIITPFEDSFKIQVAYIARDKANAERDKIKADSEKLKADSEKLDRKNRRLTNFMWSFLVLALLSIIGNILQVKLKGLNFLNKIK